jgi:hypothetical protein
MILNPNQRQVWIIGGSILLLITIYALLLQRKTYIEGYGATDNLIPKCSTFAPYDNNLPNDIANIMPRLDKISTRMKDIRKRYKSTPSLKRKRDIYQQYTNAKKDYTDLSGKIAGINSVYANHKNRFKWDESVYRNKFPSMKTIVDTFKSVTDRRRRQ